MAVCGEQGPVSEWARCRDWLVAALAEDRTEADLLAELAVNRAQLWPGERSAIVTQLVANGAAREAHVWLAGGELKEILAMMPGMTAWGRTQGCTAVVLDGRKGWVRALKPFGFKLDDDGLLRRTLS